MITLVFKIWGICLAAAVVVGGVALALEHRRQRRAWRAWVLSLPAWQSGRRGGKSAGVYEVVRR